MVEKSTVNLSEDDIKIFSSVYHLLRWKGLTLTAKRLAKEARLPQPDTSNSSTGKAVWEILRYPTKKSQPESSSESESEVNSLEDLLMNIVNRICEAREKDTAVKWP